MTSLRTFLLLSCLYLLSLSVFAQNVTITPDGITPALSSSYQRLSYDAIVALPSPQDGDIAYDVTFKCMRLYNGSKWVRLISDQDLNLPSVTGWSAGGIETDEGLGIATDNNGNIFVTGYFRNTASFGDTIVISAGGNDIFLAKYNSNGIFQWIQTAEGVGEAVSLDIAVDKDNDVCIVGIFSDSLNFSGTIITSLSGITDIFVAKYDKNGAFLWVQKGGGNGDDISNSITIDSTKSIYITGYFKNIATFGLVNITSVGNEDIFIAKYNTNGILQWIQRTGGAYTDYGHDIAVDNNGYVYITGYFAGASTIGNNSFSASGGSDIFIAKYNPVTSMWVWSINGVGSGDDSGVALTTDPVGNVYVTGYFAGTLNLYGTILNSLGMLDIFTAKFTTDGVLAWVSHSGGSYHDVGTGIALDNLGNIFVTGYFGETASFGSMSLTSNGSYDMLIMKYNALGRIQWAQKSGNIGNDQGSGIAIDGSNNIYATGIFQFSTKFGNANLTSVGETDIFIARIKE